ncbi:hypothetical protein JR316_0013287 [Psilocybe cubensis]|uniref:Uncharacterized protein n=2 Tax=Psilocybe cubensis TaxID=181762 RepID=A0ACB8GHZ3_PSICU|nr:hypothetical protein JR316_0013287 [Psilocybe cubensis]KAH9474821.1 hypothetical protein JR316_0013287 [Psilocybe cubensis]
MFSFLSQLRLPSIGIGAQTQLQEEDDDVSSSGRSLTLPFPVTESSTKKTAASTAAKREWMASHPIAPSTAGANGFNISKPIPRTANALTAFDTEFPAPPTGLGEQVHVFGQVRPIRATPPFSGAVQGPAWYEQDKSSPQASVSPPHIVRINSTIESQSINANKQAEGGSVNPPPSRPVYKYTSYPNPSAYAQPYPTSGGSSGIASAKSGQMHSTVDRDEHDNESEHEFYTSPFDDTDPLGALPPSTTGKSSMTKSRWNLKLQLHSSGAQSTPSLLVGSGTSQANRLHALPHFASQNPLKKGIPYGHKVTLNEDGQILPVDVDTDVYNNAYNYPLAKQLSPIAEQDYTSPTTATGDTESRSISLRFGKGGDGNLSKASLGTESPISVALAGATKKEQGGVSDVMEREPTRNRSGSVGSMGNGHNLSRAGSISRSIVVLPGSTNGSPIGSLMPEVFIPGPSPIHASPFITRHLNRTVSQTSSKSDSHMQGQVTPTAVNFQGQTPAPPRAVAQLSTGSIQRSATAINTPNGIAYGRETIQTPISAGTTSSTPTGPYYTPTSTLQTPTVAQAPTPTSPFTAGGIGVGAGVSSGPAVTLAPPPAAVTTNTLYPTYPVGSVESAAYPTTTPTPRLPKIPSIPNIPPLDLRFSLLGSVGPRASREMRMERVAASAAAASAAHRRSLGGDVEKMPVIPGSVEGHYEEESEDDYLEEEDDEEEEEGGEAEEDDSEEYDRESLHAESFVTAGTNEDANVGGESNVHDPELGVELSDLGKQSRSGSQSTSGSLHSRAPSASAPLSSSSRCLPATTLEPVAGTSSAPKSATGESFIHRRWDRDAALGFGSISSSPTTFRAKGQDSRWPTRLFSTTFFSSSSSPTATFTPAFWAFWLGFICPVLWLVGGWHFTNAGELPPKYTMWEWYFWSSRWSIEGFKAGLTRMFAWRWLPWVRRAAANAEKERKRGSHQSGQSDIGDGTMAQRRKGKRRSSSSQQSKKARAGKVFPSLPQWVAEKQSTDDGRMRLNDPKRSLRGISFGYPFISRPPMGSQDSCGTPGDITVPAPPAVAAGASTSTSSSVSKLKKHVVDVVSKPNRALDLLYGVQLKEVRGRPESGRRMFDPWIQRCRYAFCYAMLLLAAGLCTASVYLIAINTKKLEQ